MTYLILTLQQRHSRRGRYTDKRKKKNMELLIFMQIIFSGESKVLHFKISFDSNLSDGRIPAQDILPFPPCLPSRMTRGETLSLLTMLKMSPWNSPSGTTKTWHFRNNLVMHCACEAIPPRCIVLIQRGFRTEVMAASVPKSAVRCYVFCKLTEFKVPYGWCVRERERERGVQVVKLS